jgi:deoxyribonuclease-4
MSKEIIIGSHVSMSAPNMLVGSVKEALSYGANTFMFYTGAPQNSVRRPVEQLKVEEARKLMEENNIDINNIVVHAPYIINLANAKDDGIYELSKKLLSDELKRTAYIGCKYIVLHPGSHLGLGVELGLSRVIDGLNEVLNKDDSDVIVLLETMAGKGNEVGSSFEQIAYIIENIEKKNKIGVCFDTCHTHDSGYDLVGDLDAVIDDFDKIIGLKYLKVIHVNDSKNIRGASKDRHENIGKGYIGMDALKKVVHHPKLMDMIKILETPYIGDKAPYKEEIAILRENN